MGEKEPQEVWQYSERTPANRLRYQARRHKGAGTFHFGQSQESLVFFKDKEGRKCVIKIEWSAGTFCSAQGKHFLLIPSLVFHPCIASRDPTGSTSAAPLANICHSTFQLLLRLVPWTTLLSSLRLRRGSNGRATCCSYSALQALSDRVSPFYVFCSNVSVQKDKSSWHALLVRRLYKKDL